MSDQYSEYTAIELYHYIIELVNIGDIKEFHDALIILEKYANIHVEYAIFDQFGLWKHVLQSSNIQMVCLLESISIFPKISDITFSIHGCTKYNYVFYPNINFEELDNMSENKSSTYQISASNVKISSLEMYKYLESRFNISHQRYIEDASYLDSHIFQYIYNYGDVILNTHVINQLFIIEDNKFIDKMIEEHNIHVCWNNQVIIRNIIGANNITKFMKIIIYNNTLDRLYNILYLCASIKNIDFLQIALVQMHQLLIFSNDILDIDHHRHELACIIDQMADSDMYQKLNLQLCEIPVITTN